MIREYVPDRPPPPILLSTQIIIYASPATNTRFSTAMDQTPAPDELTLDMETTLAANGSGATLYFKKLFRAHPGFPLERGQDVYSVTVPNTCVVLFPAADQPDLPAELTIRDPDTYRLRTEPVSDTPDTHGTIHPED